MKVKGLITYNSLNMKMSFMFSRLTRVPAADGALYQQNHGIPLVKLATKIMLGQSLAELGILRVLQNRLSMRKSAGVFI